MGFDVRGARVTGNRLKAAGGSSHLKSSIHWVSACEPRPSAASIAALKPRNTWSLDMTPLVRGCSARSAQARHGVGEVAHIHADERALFCPGQVFLTALHIFVFPRGSAGRRRLGRQFAASTFMFY